MVKNTDKSNGGKREGREGSVKEELCIQMEYEKKWKELKDDKLYTKIM